MSVDLVTVVAEGAMVAAAEILARRGRELDDAGLDSMVAALRAETKAALERILDDGKAALDAGMSNGWLRVLVNAECVAAAKAAVDAVA